MNIRVLPANIQCSCFLGCLNAHWTAVSYHCLNTYQYKKTAFANYTLITTKYATLRTDIGKRVQSCAQYMCSRRSECDQHDTIVCICMICTCWGYLYMQKKKSLTISAYLVLINEDGMLKSRGIHVSSGYCMVG